MTFRQRAFMAAALLVCLPTAIWAVHGDAGFSSGGGPLTVYSSPGDDHSIPHGVDIGSREPLEQYFEPGDHTTNFNSGDPEGGRALAQPHGSKTCASGCAANNHPTPPLLKDEFHRLMGLYSQEPMSDKSEGLEYLLYYGRQSQLFLDHLGRGPLDAERETFLRRELGREHVYVELRIVDEAGVVRLWNKPARVPLDVRYGFDFQTKDLQPIEESTGTVKRVGLYHLWQRI
jgi:hypothetical protein